MRRVLKYAIPLATGVQSVVVPHGCKLLHVGAQPARPEVMVWADVSWPEDVVAEPETASVMVMIVPTGGDVPTAGWEFLGTALMDGGRWVWHLYAHRDRQGLFT